MEQGEDLTDFVREALTKGATRAEIQEALSGAGWSAEQVRSALSGFADGIRFPIPVPRPRPYTDAREMFILAVLFGTMYLVAYHVGALVFALVDRAFPPTAFRVEFSQAIRWPIAILVVVVPVFFFVSRLTAREFDRDPSRRISPIRRKLTFLTLFVCAAVLIGTLAGLVYEWLGGDLTAGFALKALTAAAIAIAVFGHYLRDTRLETFSS